jgi:hypothetical protein
MREININNSNTGKLKNRVGEKHKTNEGYVVEIISYTNAFSCSIRFEDGTVLDNKIYNNVIKGGVKNPFHRSTYGVGFYGIGEYVTSVKGSDGKITKVNSLWNSMIQRCYSEKYHLKKPTYKECEVCEEWHNFQNFGVWFDENYVDGYELDKDIIIKGNKIYSPETCCIVPREINGLLVNMDSKRGSYPIGVSKMGTRFSSKLARFGELISLGSFDTPEEAFLAYKEAKEEQIKYLANLHKHDIKPHVYDALMNYVVEITD